MVNPFSKDLETIDRIDLKGISEHEIHSQIKAIVPHEHQNRSTEMIAELMAFDFLEDCKDKDFGWGTYYGPSMVWNNEDGSRTEIPSLSMINWEMLDYWKLRSGASVNPLMKSRYSDLVWDFEYKVTGQKPSVEFCRITILSNIQIALEDFHRYEFQAFTKLKRALNLSISINEAPLLNDCKSAIILYEKKLAGVTKGSTLGHSFDLLVGNRHVDLTESEKEDIIDLLEDKLVIVTAYDKEGSKLDPWAGEAIARRLANYYRKNNQKEDVYRVLLLVGDAYNHIIKDSNPLQTSAWLDTLYKLFSDFGLNEEAQEVLLRIRKVGPEVSANLHEISDSVTFSKEQLDTYLSEMLSGKFEDALMRLIARFIPYKEEVKELVLNLSKENPISYILTKQVQDLHGRLIATIGPLSEDLEGHIVLQVSDNMSFLSVFLRLVIEEAEKRFGLNTELLMGFIQESPIIDPKRLRIISKAIDFFFSGDYISSIHLLIPQIEEVIRNLLEINGGNILKPKSNAYQLKTFDEVLRDPIVLTAFGEDITHYLQVLFTDPRGWNLRNRVSHGLIDYELFDAHFADRVLHALLCLGLVRASNIT